MPKSNRPSGTALPKRDASSDSDVMLPVKVNSATLFANAREIVIEHDEKLYRLRITKNGKLILTA